MTTCVAIFSQSEGSHKWCLNDHEDICLQLADHKPIMPGNYKGSQYDMQQIEHQMEQLAMGSAGERETRPKKSRASHYQPIFDTKKDYATWQRNMNEAHNNGDWRGPQKYTGPNMTTMATTWSAILATPRLRQLAPVKPPQTPGNQDNGQDSGSHRLRVGPKTDSTWSVKEGPTQKEITKLQL